MSIGSLNSPLSLQESQLLQILQQQNAFRAKAKGTEADDETAAAKTGQNLPGGTDVLGYDSSANLDPDLSPAKISALLLALQTSQASLDTTLLLSSTTAGGGNSLADYLTGNNNVANANPWMDDDAEVENADSGEDAGVSTLVDYLS